MKKTSLKIGLHPAQILRDLGSGIFEIRIQYPDNIYERKIAEYTESQLKNKNHQAALKDFLLRKGIDVLPEEAMKINLQHIFKADTYFTNGQSILSCIKRDEQFELFEHAPEDFTHFHVTPCAFFRLSILSIQPIEAISERNRDLEVIKLLSKREVKFLPILESDDEWAMMRQSLIDGYEFRYGDKVLTKRAAFYEGRGLDKILREFIDRIRPATLKCCLNCEHFKFSGMSYEMSGGTVGYCGLLQENSEKREGLKDVVTEIDAWCGDFRIVPA